MSIPKRHHFVPKCYLDNFTQNGLLFTLDIKKVLKGYNEYPIQINPSGICYIDYYYLIQPYYKNQSFKLSDQEALTIEVDILKKIEDKYSRLFSTVISGEIKLQDAKDISDFIIQMKIRNPFYLDNTINTKKDTWLELASADALEALAKNSMYENIPIAIKEIVAKSVIAESLNDKDFDKQYQLFSLYQRSKNTSRNERLRKAIINCKWVIHKSPDSGPHFVTTDNPGVSICKKGLIYNTKFEDGFIFYFPLSPLFCLAISDFDKDFYYDRQEENKVIQIVPIGLNEVYQINDRVIQKANKLLIAREENYLSAIAGRNKPKESNRKPEKK